MAMALASRPQRLTNEADGERHVGRGLGDDQGELLAIRRHVESQISADVANDREQFLRRALIKGIR